MLPLFPHEDTERAQQIVDIIKPLADAYWDVNDPKLFQTNPFACMVTSMLSPRTKTQQSRGAMLQLFALADNPADMAQLDYELVHDILHKNDVQFPEAKAKNLLASAKLLAENGGDVPRDHNLLMQYPGMGWKTSLLTLLLAYDIAPEICVDIHVMRIGQRMGLVNLNTTQPQKVSRELMDIVPPQHWKDWNPMFVYFGKMRCTPTNPKCDGCPIFHLCDRVDVD